MMYAFKKFVASATLAAAIFFGSLHPADALTFNWSFSGTGVSGSGQFFGILDFGNQYSLTGINGTIIEGVTPLTITGLSNYAGSDNKLLYNLPNLTTFAGISFATAALVSYNIFTNGADIHYGLLESIGNPGGGTEPRRAIAFNVTATPIPPALVLFLSALGLGGLLRRKPGGSTPWAA